MAKKLCWRKEEGKFRLDADGSHRYGLQFSTYKAMRKAITRKYGLKKCGR